MKLLEIGKMVGDPFNGFSAMKALSLLSERVGRLHRNDLMADCGECRGVAPRPRPDIEDPRGRGRKEMHHLSVDLIECDALILFGQCRRVVAVPLRSLDHRFFFNPARMSHAFT
ncbi:hypothetical protein [Azospirillum palustre]